MDSFQETLLDLMVALNSPRSDDRLLRKAKVAIDRALVPLLIRIRLRGPIAVGALADQSGRDESTVSRQVGKLEKLGLISRHVLSGDERTRVAVVTERGEAVVVKIGEVRDQMVDEALQEWTKRDRADLKRLVRRLADSASASMHRL
jgi:DNA-binding MarR family transcriptional regulator